MRYTIWTYNIASGAAVEQNGGVDGLRDSSSLSQCPPMEIGKRTKRGRTRGDGRRHYDTLKSKEIVWSPCWCRCVASFSIGIFRNIRSDKLHWSHFFSYFINSSVFFSFWHTFECKLRYSDKVSCVNRDSSTKENLKTNIPVPNRGVTKLLFCYLLTTHDEKRHSYY